MAIAITITHKTTGTNGADQSSYTTGSWTPTANRLLIMGIGANTQPSSISGNGVTWSLIKTQANGSFPIYLYGGIATSPSAGTTSINFSVTINQCCWTINECDANVDLTGGVSGAFVQTNGANNNTTVTLSAFTRIENATFGFVRTIASTTFTQGSGFTLLGQAATGESSICSEYKQANDTTVDWSFSPDGNTSAIAAEIKAFIPPSGSNPLFFTNFSVG